MRCAVAAEAFVYFATHDASDDVLLSALTQLTALVRVELREDSSIDVLDILSSSGAEKLPPTVRCLCITTDL